MFRVNGADELPDDLHGTVGVTAGASAPEELVEAVIARLAPADGVEEVRVTDEDEYFPPPRNLRDLLAAIDAAATTMPGGSLDAGRRMDDRALAASDVLAALQDVTGSSGWVACAGPACGGPRRMTPAAASGQGDEASDEHVVQQRRAGPAPGAQPGQCLEQQQQLGRPGWPPTPRPSPGPAATDDGVSCRSAAARTTGPGRGMPDTW